MAEWPLSLPSFPLVQGYGEQLAETRLRTQMDAGPPKMRGRFRAGTDSLTVAMVMDTAQSNVLVAFYKNTLDGGTLPFDYVHPRTGEQRAFSFVEPPSLTPAESSGAWIAQLSLEYVGSVEDLSFVDLDFGAPGNSGYLILLEDI